MGLNLWTMAEKWHVSLGYCVYTCSYSNTNNNTLFYVPKESVKQHVRASMDDGWKCRVSLGFGPCSYSHSYNNTLFNQCTKCMCWVARTGLNWYTIGENDEKVWVVLYAHVETVTKTDSPFLILCLINVHNICFKQHVRTSNDVRRLIMLCKFVFITNIYVVTQKYISCRNYSLLLIFC